MGLLATYLRELARIRNTGEATDETSFYPAISGLLNSAGELLSPAVHCVMTPRNRGAGIPDGALFLRRAAAGDPAAGEVRAPERGVLEVKSPGQPVARVARSRQVRRYLEQFGQVVVTNYREFIQLRVDSDGNPVSGETFVIADDELALWRLDPSGDEVAALENDFEGYLRRTLASDAPLTSPEELAWFLAAYARTARQRVIAADERPALLALRSALEDALGLRFEGDRGREFFHSALVQTLFYGVFAGWVNWSADHDPDSNARFEWRTAQWSFNVPMVRVLFDQLATPRNLPAGLDEVLDWTEDVFARVDRRKFFERFERREAVQHFYEPFLNAYDPELRRELGVWYTPPEVVGYMVSRVHETLKRDLGLRLGLADERVHVLDPCTGTGSFLLEVLRTIVGVLEEEHGDALVAQHAKEAALRRLHGFEILPAPFIVTHLQLGLMLAELGAPLDAKAQERPSVYLTNALTGWFGDDEPLLQIDEFQAERDAAGNVKRTEPILVVLGNPPYNGFTGVASADEQELVRAYKEGLSSPPWEVTKNKLDDYYVRFFRVGERRIAEQTGRGIICFISNFGWLGDPSAVVMRRRLLREFDRLYIDNLNGDSRETGKKTPDGRPDPSIFSTKLNPAGIQVGTAISLLVRTDAHSPDTSDAYYRDFWGPDKRAALVESLSNPLGEPAYDPLLPDETNWYRLRRWKPRLGYELWPLVTQLAAAKPELGLNENRGEALVSIDREPLDARMRHFLDPGRAFDDLEPAITGGLTATWSDYDARATRERMLSERPFEDDAITRFQVGPFDLRWAYVDPTPKLWNRARPQYIAAAMLGSPFLMLRKRAPRALDGAAFFLSRHLADQHLLHKDAYAIPILLARPEPAGDARLFEPETDPDAQPWQPNLSEDALAYLSELGYDDAHESRETASLIWLHALAIGYSPLYLDENGDAIRNGWPRVPLPEDADALEASARLGARIAGLLDLDTEADGVTGATKALLQSVATVVGDAPADLELRSGWAIVQRRTQKSGAVSRIVMPSDGRAVARLRTTAESAPLSQEQIELLGDDVIDVYLNESTYWSGVPRAAWMFKVGGFQVLRKWLSYRDAAVLARPLSVAEAREFTSIARRLTQLALLGPELDANYRVAAGAVVQDPLPDLESVTPA